MSKLVIFSGAGLSADSGITTFRNSGGLWEGYDPMKVADFSTWRENFSLVHSFYNDRRTQLATVQPNAAHSMVADWCRRYTAVNITQNVDDLLERAGCADVSHVHGLLTEMKCVACGDVFDIGYRAWGAEDRCACNSLKGVKPGVIFFGEDAPRYRHMWKTYDAMTPADVLVVIGTSAQVVNVGAAAGSHPGPSILLNLDPDEDLDRYFTHVFHGRAAERITEVDAKLRELLG